MGLVGGFGTLLLIRAGLLDPGNALRIAVTPNSCCASKRAPAPMAPVWRFWNEPARAQVFLVGAAATSWFLIRWLALAFAIESVMTTWLPPATIAQWLGTGPFAIPLAVLIGVPVYINGLAAVPFVAGLLHLVLSPAPALPFLLPPPPPAFPPTP